MIQRDNLLLDPGVEVVIELALEEDVGMGDVTSIALIEETAQARGVIIAKEDAIISGGTLAERVFKDVDQSMAIEYLCADGQFAKADQPVLAISGSVRSILTAERTALNFMQRMTGIATLTQAFVAIASKHDVMILDTRKTTPAYRMIEKYAVACGGGMNHRMGLYDRVLIKDNHRKAWTTGAQKGLAEAVETAREQYPSLLIEIEVETADELKDALQAKPDWVLLDNMGPERLKECVSINNGVAKLEASGGITMMNVEAIAETGIDAISLGCLTHSAPSADLSLELDE